MISSYCFMLRLGALIPRLGRELAPVREAS